jgi:phosphatidylglycerophosphate synthase
MVNKLEDKHENIFDLYLLRFIDTHLHIYKRLNLTPNIITTFSLISGLTSGYMIYKKNFKIAGLLFFLAYYFDCVDGKFARKYNMVTKFGDMYDHISDIFKFFLVIFLLYKDNTKKFARTGIIIILLIFLCLYQISCQQAIYENKNKDKDNNSESPTLDYFKPSKESCLVNIYDTKYFGCGTAFVFTSIIIFFWEQL